MSIAQAQCPVPHDLRYPFERDREHPLEPPAMYLNLLEERPVAKVTLWNGNEAWLVTRHQDVGPILRDPRFSSVTSHANYPTTSPTMAQTKAMDTTFLRLDRPVHTEHRRMWAPYFSPSRMESLRPGVQRIVDQTLDAMLAKPAPLDFIANFALPVPSSVIGELLDVPEGDHEFFQEHANIRISSNSTPEQSRNSTEALHDYWTKLVNERAKDPGVDVVSKLYVSEVLSGNITKDELIGMARLMLTAGHETTGNMIGLGTVLLLQNPDYLARIKDDPSLTLGAVDDMLRYLTIAHLGLGRVAMEDVTVGDQVIKQGDGVILLVAAANRDPSQFDNPEVFGAQPGSRKHLAFGGGIHHCLGNPLARLELQIAFDTLFRRAPNLRLVDALRDIDFKFESAFFGVRSLMVEW
jgi:hypothetical protein